MIFIKTRFLFLISAILIIWIFGTYYILIRTNKINSTEDKIKYQDQDTDEEIKNIIELINQHERVTKYQDGEMGKKVTLPKEPSQEIQDKIADGWKKHSFNQYVSDLISVHRSLPDPRDEWCTYPYRYDINLPKTSVIISFHNEAWSVLLRSIYSIMDRSPPNYLEEIILVDDFSDMEHLKKPLDDYFVNEPKVKVIRNKQREGLIRSRLIGTSQAKGKVLTFLDSHIEVAPGWLEPLLNAININYTTVVFPVIDIINSNTFEYHLNDDVNVGGFDWNLIFTWHRIPEREEQRRSHFTDPVRSPTMPGGIFSISKKFFEEVGTYDEGFEFWGGENLELSFKIWMCGGILEVVPCSHVGHIFRESIPYGGPSKSSLRRNTRRLAEVWLDDYKKYHYQRRGEADEPIGNIVTRLELRNSLKCKSFKWYLDNVYPEMFVPENIRGYGLVGANNFCLDSWGTNMDTYKPLPIKECYSTSLGASQFWYYSDKNEIRKENACMDFNSDESKDVLLYSCHGNLGTQQWDYQSKTGLFVHTLSNGCLKVNEVEEKLEVVKCNANDISQNWFLENLRVT